LAQLAKRIGIPSKHNTRWPRQKKHAPGTLFSDGGAHFEWDRGREPNYKRLARKYPRARFVLSTRDTRSWCISKCRHAGWRSSSTWDPELPGMPSHDQWRMKTRTNVRGYIEYKEKHESRVMSFFRTLPKRRYCVINLAEGNAPKRLARLAGIKNPSVQSTPHCNKGGAPLQNAELFAFIDKSPWGKSSELSEL
jgi:hypothetical protein